MELSAVLTSIISDFTLDDDGVNVDVTGSLELVNQDLKLIVDSYRGLRLVWVGPHQSVTLTVPVVDGDPSEAVTSLQLPLDWLSPELSAVDPRSTITFYASTPGAFLDLASDLCHSYQRLGCILDVRGHPSSFEQTCVGVVVDDDLPPRTIVPELAGVAECTHINRAIGMLIGSGLMPDDAEHELSRRAAEAGLTPADWANQLVAAATGSPEAGSGG